MTSRRSSKTTGQLDESVQACAAWDAGDLRGAFRLFRKGAKAGDVSCQINLSVFYDSGIGIKANPEAALDWWQKAYEQGDASGANNIGVAMRDAGRTREAIRWFTRAIDLGDDDSALELARLRLKAGRRDDAIVLLRRVTRSKVRATPSSRDEARQLLRSLRRGRMRA